jgi:ribosome maturation protein Sdo1
MTKGTNQEVKVHFKGSSDDYIIYVNDVESVQKWKEDKSIPMVDVVNAFQVFVTHRQGAQGILDSASNADMDSEFGTHKVEDVVQQILEKGEVVTGKSSSKEADKNPTNGPGISSRGGVHN